MRESYTAIVFDGDDTLWQTQILYEDAKRRFYDWMAGEGWEDREFVAENLTRTDVANVSQYGFSRHRFSQSLKDVYHKLSLDAGRRPDADKLEQVGQIGYTVFEHKPQLMDGAIEVLTQLRRRYHLYLYTAGDPEVQERRIRELEMEQYFDAVYIPARKTVEELKQLLEAERLTPNSTWTVGNSVKSDINPALRLGLAGIWVRTLSWQYEEAELLPGRVWIVSGLREIPTVLSEAEG